MERITIALAPDLPVKARDFVDAWNAGEDSRTVALAETAHADAEHFEPVSLTAVLVGIAAGVATNVISELIKKVLKNKETDIEVVETIGSDGSRTRS